MGPRKWRWLASAAFFMGGQLEGRREEIVILAGETCCRYNTN